ncbi:hypothetical protein RRG08_004422 [Elysia crispata]|uniref:Uncharacterized protein n=1 Tax=Elysia crispata TaxID=231223 RepID=A0AAE0Y6A1_9GAST|nr:hypothetical protein RRG08_004422 [Elysia crispata]
MTNRTDLSVPGRPAITFKTKHEIPRHTSGDMWLLIKTTTTTTTTSSLAIMMAVCGGGDASRRTLAARLPLTLAPEIDPAGSKRVDHHSTGSAASRSSLNSRMRR